jgi:hypothetical protein
MMGVQAGLEGSLVAVLESVIKVIYDTAGDA